MIPLVFVLLAVTALVSFVYGWIAHGNYARGYRTERHVAVSLPSAGSGQSLQQSPQPVVMHVHLPPVLGYPSHHWVEPVIDGDVVYELPATQTTDSPGL